MATTTNLSPVTTGVYAAAIDAVSIDPTDIPATINAAAGVLRDLVAALGTGHRPWTYQPRRNCPHAGWVCAETTPSPAVVADVHTTPAGSYLAVMGPPAAVALAEWLTAAADRERDYQTDPVHTSRTTTCPGPEPADEAFAALVVAHTILNAARRTGVTR